MAGGVPHLKSNRVEDIRLVLQQFYSELSARISSGTSSTEVSGNREIFVLNGGRVQNTGVSERGLPGDDGRDGVDGVDGQDGAAFLPLWVRSHARVPVRTRFGEMLTTHQGWLIETRVRDVVPLVDHENNFIRRSEA